MNSYSNCLKSEWCWMIRAWCKQQAVELTVHFCSSDLFCKFGYCQATAVLPWVVVTLNKEDTLIHSGIMLLCFTLLCVWCVCRCWVIVLVQMFAMKYSTTWYLHVLKLLRPFNSRIWIEIWELPLVTGSSIVFLDGCPVLCLKSFHTSLKSNYSNIFFRT